MLFYLTLNDWLEKKFLMKQGEVLFAVKHTVLETAYDNLD